MPNPENYPKYLEEAGFRFVDRLHPRSNKVPTRQASSDRTVPESEAMSGHQFGLIKGNIRNTIDRASPDQIQRGLQWYPIGHRIAERISPHDIEKGAGVIAALSGGGTEWVPNVRTAEHFMKHGNMEVGQFGSKATAEQIDQARRIYEGEDFRNVLPRGLKTYNFATLLTNPNDEESIAVDTHHHDLGTGLKMPWKTDRGLSSIGRYNTFADATRMIAKEKGMLPHEAQAIAWLGWKEMKHPYRGHPRAVDMQRRARGR